MRSAKDIGWGMHIGWIDAFVYHADLYCEDCGRAIRKELKGHRNTGDSDDYPQGPYPDGGGEADSPWHCNSGEECINAMEIEGVKIGVWLGNPLTSEGVKYLKEMLSEPNPTAYQQALHDFWLRVYSDYLEGWAPELPPPSPQLPLPGVTERRRRHTVGEAEAERWAVLVIPPKGDSYWLGPPFLGDHEQMVKLAAQRQAKAPNGWVYRAEPYDRTPEWWKLRAMAETKPDFWQGERILRGDEVRIHIKGSKGQPFESFWYTVPYSMMIDEIVLQFAQSAQPGMFVEIMSGKLKWKFRVERYAGLPSVARVRSVREDPDYGPSHDTDTRHFPKLTRHRS